MAALLLALLALPLRDDPPGDGLEPVTVTVLDAETGGPVLSLRYGCGSSPRAARAGGPGLDAGRVALRHVRRPSTEVLQAPPGGQGRDHLGGRAMDHEFLIREAGPRGVVVKLMPGITVRGTVARCRDEGPDRRGEGAAALAHRAYEVSLDEEWAVATDEGGRYELHGVDPERGVWASHPDYRFEEDRRRGIVRSPHDILLPPGEVLRGTVRDAAGKPLEGVDVEDWNHRRARTGADGTFALKNGGWDLTFKKDGHISRRLSGKDEVRRDHLVVVMEPRFALEGRVVGTDGRPVGVFAVSVGPAPLPGGFECSRADVKDPSGRFALGLDHAGPHWVGVRADGFAAWEGLVDVARAGKPVDVRLDPGVTASGRVVPPARAGGAIRATLAPRRDKSGVGGMWFDEPERFAERAADVAQDGTLSFEHVRPDRYVLELDGPTITPARLALDVPPEGLGFGAIRLAGRGRVVGRVFRPEDDADGGGPWPFCPIGVLWPADRWRKDFRSAPARTAGSPSSGCPPGWSASASGTRSSTWSTPTSGRPRSSRTGRPRSMPSSGASRGR